MSIYPHILSSHSVTFILSRSILFPVNTYIIYIYVYFYHLINIAILGCTNPQVAPKCDLFSTKHTTHSGVHASASSWHSRPRISGCFLTANRSVEKPCSARRLPRWIQSGGVKRVLYHNQRFLSPQRGPNAPKRCRIQDFEAAWCHCRLSDANAKGEQQVSPIPSFLTWTVLLNVYHWFWFLIVHVHTRCSGWIIGKCQWRYTALPRHVELVFRHGAFWSIIYVYVYMNVCIYIYYIMRPTLGHYFGGGVGSKIYFF